MRSDDRPQFFWAGERGAKVLKDCNYHYTILKAKFTSAIARVDHEKIDTENKGERWMHGWIE